MAAAATVLAAYLSLKPKFLKIAAIERETATREPAFVALYVVPQYLTALVVALVFLTVAFVGVHAVEPSTGMDWPGAAHLAPILVPGNLVLILFLNVAMGGVIYVNGLSRALLLLSRLIAILPLPPLHGAFGPRGRSCGWHQAQTVCKEWDGGTPLLVDNDELERIADAVITELAKPTTASDFAERPTSASDSAAANIALFGCLLESKHYQLKWKSPKWSAFYAALGAIHGRTQMFEPAELVKFSSPEGFFEALNSELLQEPLLQSEPRPKGGYAGAANDVGTAWAKLRIRGGDVRQLVPAWASKLKTDLFWLDRRLRTFPRFDSDGMRPQLIKLLLRWRTLKSVQPSVFMQPFSRHQAWFLLQERVLRVLPEQKEVTFVMSSDVQISRTACLRVCERARDIVRARASQRDLSLDGRFESDWDLLAQADFTLWQKARSEHERGRAQSWKSRAADAVPAVEDNDTAAWIWKLENGHAVKI